VLTGNVHAENQPTVRLYRIFDVCITDTGFVQTVLSHNQRYSNRYLEKLAHENARRGGRGWANALLVTPLEALISFYLAMPEVERNSPARFDGLQLEPNVTTLLDNSLASRYQRV
jgi:hypothetical protein